MNPTGRVVEQDGRHVLVLTRTFDAPIEDVWAAVTEPDRTARWIGTWSGDPASGTVQFRMVFEEGHEGNPMTIRVCEPPQRLHVTSHLGEEDWLMELELVETDGVTTLTFSQPGIDPGQVGEVGPGWEYYLDRLIDAETGGDPEQRDFDRDYYPAMSGYYSQQLG